jgi:hypothetical protein
MEMSEAVLSGLSLAHQTPSPDNAVLTPNVSHNNQDHTNVLPSPPIFNPFKVRQSRKILPANMASMLSTQTTTLPTLPNIIFTSPGSPHAQTSTTVDPFDDTATHSTANTTETTRHQPSTTPISAPYFKDTTTINVGTIRWKTLLTTPNLRMIKQSG